MRFTGGYPRHIITHANSRRSAHLRRRPPGSGLLGNPAPRGRPLHPSHARHPAERAAAFGGHGHRHRGTSRHHHRPGRRHRHRAQEHVDRSPGARGRPRQEVRKRRHQGSDHRLAQHVDPRSARPHPVARDLRSAGGGRQESRRHRHAPRPALRGPAGGAGVLGDDASGAPGHGARGRAQGRSARTAASPPHREAAGGERRARAGRHDHREGLPESQRISARLQGRARAPRTVIPRV
jgi:hypothetical protein